MTHERTTIYVDPESELARQLAAAGGQPVVMETGGRRYRVTRADASAAACSLPLADEDDIWAHYDPERVRAALRATAGSWGDLDPETLKAELYRAREEGTRPLERP